MIHVVTSRGFDLRKAAADAASGKSPGHVLVDLAARLDGPDAGNIRFHSPSGDLLATRADQLRSRLIGRPDLWALARHVIQQARPDDTLYTTGEDIGIPLAAVAAAMRKKPRLLVTVHNLSRPRARMALRFFQAARTVDTWLTPAPRQADYLIEHVGIPADKVRVLPEQTDTSFYYPAPHNHRRSRPTIVSVGLEQRDYRTLATATADMPVDVKISGFSKDARALKQAFPEHLPANMSRRFYEWTELRELYWEADIVVVSLFPNRYVAGITTFLEALACRRPVILTRTEGLAGYCDIPGICLTVPPLSPMALRAAIQHLLQSPSTAETLAQHGHDWLLAGHTPRHWVDALLNIIAEEPALAA